MVSLGVHIRDVQKTTCLSPPINAWKKVYACMHDYVQVRRKHGGLKFKVEESWVDTVSGETRALG